MLDQYGIIFYQAKKLELAEYLVDISITFVLIWDQKVPMKQIKRFQLPSHLECITEEDTQDGHGDPHAEGHQQPEYDEELV